MREIDLDVEEGADIIMVKPALPYLDIIRRAKEEFDLPIAAYNVSGEFAMIKAAAQPGLARRRAGHDGVPDGIKRAGADMIITYFAWRRRSGCEEGSRVKVKRKIHHNSQMPRRRMSYPAPADGGLGGDAKLQSRLRPLPGFVRPRPLRGGTRHGPLPTSCWTRSPPSASPSSS